MTDGYIIKLSDASEIEVIPGVGAARIVIGDAEVTFDGEVKISDPGNEIAGVDAAQVTDYESASDTKEDIQDESEGVGIKRKCINCRGRRYCITNACANTPCGWICDR